MIEQLKPELLSFVGEGLRHFKSPLRFFLLRKKIAGFY